LDAAPSEIVIFNPIERQLRKIVVNALQKIEIQSDLHAYIAMRVKDIKTMSYMPEYNFVTTWNSQLNDHLGNTGKMLSGELNFFFKFTKEELYTNLYYGSWSVGTALAISGIGMVKLDQSDRWLVLINDEIMGEFHLRKMILEGQYFGEFGNVLDGAVTFNYNEILYLPLISQYSHDS